MMLHSKISGTDSGDQLPLILIHGLFGMGDNLSMVARAFQEQSIVHSLDLRNHGRSPRADTMAFSAMAADVLEYLDSQQIERARIVGHSLGGKVAMQLALTHPERVAQLVVADISPVDYLSNAHDSIFTAINAVDLSSLKSRKDAEQVLDHYIDEAGVKLFLLKNLYRREDGSFDWRINVPVLEACYAQIRSGIESEQAYSGDVLFIKGGDSAYIQDKHWPTIQRLFPAARLEEIAGAGHWLHAEKTAEFNQLLVDFFQ